MGLFDKIFNKKNINDNKDKEVIILSEEKDDIQEQIKKAMEL